MSNDTTGSTLDQLSAVLEAKFGIERDAVTPSTVLEEDLDLDSLALIELSLSLQKQFGVVIATDGIKPTDTVADLVALFEAELAKA